MRLARGIIAGFLQDESGTVTVEALLWFTGVSAFLFLLVEATNGFYSYSSVTQIMHDANRQMSVGRWRTTLETQTYIETELEARFPGATAVATIEGSNVLTRVTIPQDNLFLARMRLDGTAVTFQASHRLEWM